MPALTINWGPWSGGGLAAREGRDLLERMGIATLTPRQTLAALRTHGSLIAPRADKAWLPRLPPAEFV